MKVVIVALCLFAAVSADVLAWREIEPHVMKQDKWGWEAPKPEPQQPELQPEEEGAPKPKPCCTPTQWEGYMGEYTAYYSYRHHHPGLAVLNAKLSYDAKGKRVAVTAQMPKRPPVKVIMDYSKNKTYLIFTKSKKCKVAKTRKPFRPACIPKNAKSLGSFYMGAGGAKLNENAWAVKAHGFNVVATVTKTGCIPVGEVVMGHARGTLIFSNLGFVNISPGIKDPKVFTPPAYCKSMDEEDMNVGEEYPILEYLKYRFQEE